MALPFFKDQTLTDQKKNQKYLALILLVVVCVTGFAIWKGFFEKAPELESVSVPPVFRKDIRINFSFLEDKIFKEIQNSPLPRLLPQNIGKTNPFL